MPYAILAEEKINGRAHKVVASKADAAVDGAVLCSPSVQIGDVFDGVGGFMSRAAVNLGDYVRSVADARANAVARAEEIASAARERVAGTGDATKLAVYREKYATAQEAIAGDANAIAALDEEARARGETTADLAALVIHLGDQWRAAVLAIDAVYQKHKAAISALDDISALDSYDASTGWPF